MNFKRAAAYNIIGTVMPMFAALISIPLLLAGIGNSRMGIFTLLMGLFGFSSVLDLGLGRALTREVARMHGQGFALKDIAPIIRYAFEWVLLFGLIAAGIVIAGKHEVVTLLTAHASALETEVDSALIPVALLIPVTLASGALIGVLEGASRFDLSNFIRGPNGVLSVLVPAIVAFLSQSLVLAVWSMAATRSIFMCVAFFMVNKQMPLRRAVVDQAASKRLWGFGAGLSVSNIVGPMMVYADRYYLATLFPPAAIARYTVPFDTLFRATALPAAILGVLFPKIARSNIGDAQVSSDVFQHALLVYGIFWVLPLVLGSIWLEPILGFWLSQSASAEGASIARWVLAGVAVNGLALLPFTIIQALGRSDVTARMHVFELAIYACLLVFLVSAFGLIGAAIAWSTRVLIDCIALFGYLALRRLVGKRVFLLSVSISIGASALIVFAGAFSPSAKYFWTTVVVGIWISAFANAISQRQIGFRRM